ncbi:hypothetical protein TNCV_4980161 [Trichonephila clavipes]|nr:hypothetical protein TNCV_4980161 [Trichonephila clavipes]
MVTNDAKMVTKVAKLASNLVTKMMPNLLYRQDFAKFSLNRHYNIEEIFGKAPIISIFDEEPVKLHWHMWSAFIMTTHIQTVLVSRGKFNVEHNLNAPAKPLPICRISYTSLPDGHGYELVSSVRALVPQQFSVEEKLMHVKHVEVKSPHVGVMWKFGRGVISSGIVLVT